MIYVQSQETFEAYLTGAPTGLVGTLTYKLIDPPANTVMTAETTAGITEPETGTYTKTDTAPEENGTYLVVWDNAGTVSVEELVVTGYLPLTPADVGVGLTFEELQDEVFAVGFKDLDDAGGGLARVKRFINEAYRSVCERYPFPFLFADASGTAPLSVTNCRQVLTVLDSSNDNVLVPIDRRTLQDASPDLPDSGTASWWYWDSDTSLAVYPADTGSTFKVRYVKNPGDLSDGSDRPLVPSRYQQAIVDLAAAKCWRNLANYEAAQWHEAAAETLIQQMIVSYGTRQGDMPETIEDVMWVRGS